ncbi:hypothetical protein TEQG_05668 [Trichophyton equinum CBS 127.97]|uniref:Uncharacterized protein n=1 Tax=Trichophyton equinum (strain ATCC MYA-4606 / CBS 127.97) TaxID=559882 RepID=F2PXQ6_TRIEC|nr:hypothetical protein TEQG_05668 [Trichophyton equinum CBS 127.97]
MTTGPVILVPLRTAASYYTSPFITHTVEVQDVTPTFRPDQIHANIGDSILFQSRGPDVSVIESNLSPLCTPKKAGLPQENLYLVTDTMPHLFYQNGHLSATPCSYKSVFKLNFHLHNAQISTVAVYPGSRCSIETFVPSGYHYNTTGTAASGTGLAMQFLQSGYCYGPHGSCRVRYWLTAVAFAIWGECHRWSKRSYP